MEDNTERNIYSNEEFQALVADCSEKARVSITVFSAFIKLNAIKWLDQHISTRPEIKIIARWRPEDLAFKASDLEVYEFCQARGWRFGIDVSLHSKAFIFDSSSVLLGSANLTDRGLSISNEGNLEMGTVIKPTIADLERLKTLEEKVFWMNDDIYNELALEVKGMNIDRPKIPSWSPELSKRLEPAVEFLWVNELLHSSPESLLWPDFDDSDQLHDINLLGLVIGSYQDETAIKRAFLTSRMYLWFKFQLAKEDGNSYTNFGWLTEKLHNALLDDPPPQRSGIKQYVADFVEWLKEFAVEEIEITNHQRTISFNLKRSTS